MLILLLISYVLCWHVPVCQPRCYVSSSACASVLSSDVDNSFLFLSSRQNSSWTRSRTPCYHYILPTASVCLLCPPHCGSIAPVCQQIVVDYIHMLVSVPRDMPYWRCTWCLQLVTHVPSPPHDFLYYRHSPVFSWSVLGGSNPRLYRQSP